jgi:predicted O-methyltransferase YrrM
LLSARHIAYLYLAYFSKPVADRALYRAIHRHRWQRILEIGVGSGRRALRMLDVASRRHAKEDLFYVGIDQFEGRPAASPGLSLKEAHCHFKARQFKAQLLPGDPYSTLMRAANALRNIDLVVISADQNAASLAQAWFYLPRMLHATSAVYQEQIDPQGVPTLVALDRATVDARAVKPHRRSVA